MDFEIAASSFAAVAKLKGLTVSLAKSKGTVVSNGVDAHGLSLVPAGDGFIDLCSSIFVNKSLSIDTKIIMCLCCYCFVHFVVWG